MLYHKANGQLLILSPETGLGWRNHARSTHEACAQQGIAELSAVRLMDTYMVAKKLTFVLL